MTGQTDFHRALRAPEQPIPAGLSGPGGAAADRRFNVYRNNVATSLMDALETGFPVVRNLLGDQNFRNLARQFQWQHPPRSPLMMHYGAEFPEFLASLPQLAKLPYLDDVARLELALRRSYHAADAAPIAPDRLASLPPEQMLFATFTLAPAVQVLPSAWPIFGLWRFNTQPGAAKPQARAECVLITRKEFDPQPQLITRAEAGFLTDLRAATPLGQAVDTATSLDPQFDFAALLASLLGQGALIDLTTSEAPA